MTDYGLDLALIGNGRTAALLVPGGRSVTSRLSIDPQFSVSCDHQNLARAASDLTSTPSLRSFWLSPLRLSHGFVSGSDLCGIMWGEVRMLSSVRGVSQLCLGLLLMALAPGLSPVFAQEPAVAKGRTITGTVQNQDLRRVPQASVEVKDQEGTVVGAAVGADAIPIKIRG